MTDNSQTNRIQFIIQKIYIKDISFQIPNGTLIFNQSWKPELNIALNTEVNTLTEKNIYEAVLNVEAHVKCDNKDAFKIEVQQAGIFQISNMDNKQLNHAKYAFCPNILYPYARETISDIVTKGGFPQLCLAPVNFDILYQQKQQEKS